MEVTAAIIIFIVFIGVIWFFSQKAQDKDDTYFLGSIMKAAEMGDPIAQFKLANMYYEGRGLARNDPEAAGWYARAAEQEHSEAQFILGTMYEKGDGVVRNDDEAYKWISRAARQGHARARVMLESDKWVNHTNARKVGHESTGSTQEGALHHEPSPEQIDDYIRRAGEGDMDAQYNLGIIYYHGEGVPRNFEGALIWFHRAAEQNDADAQYNLGLMYGKGEGVDKSHKHSLEWFQKAAEQGHSGAKEILEKMMRKVDF